MSRAYSNYADIIDFTRASTGTYLDSDGLLKTASVNTPRIEYDADGNLLGLLVEESRTNLLTYSEQFDNADWAKSNITASANAATSPNGVTTADKLIPNTASTQHYVRQTITLTDSTIYALTVYAKAEELIAIRLSLGTKAGAFPGAYFNLSTGVVTNEVSSPISTSITPVGNGWYRCTVVANSGTGASVPEFRVWAISSVNTISFSGNDSDGIYLWGAQLEAGSFPTSYIKTEGATATRSADVASIATSEFGYNDAAGTIYVDGTFRDTETIVTLGSTTIDADADGKKDYTATYSADPSATSLVLNRGAYNALKYYPRVLTSAQLGALTS